MDNNLNFLQNKTVKNIELVHDYLQITFTDSSVLNIYNISRIDGERSKIKSSILINTQRNSDNLILMFSSDVSISVDMSENGFNGPEAMEYRHDDRIIIID